VLRQTLGIDGLMFRAAIAGMLTAVVLFVTTARFFDREHALYSTAVSHSP
jgi:hypothetical protein